MEHANLKQPNELAIGEWFLSAGKHYQVYATDYCYETHTAIINVGWVQWHKPWGTKIRIPAHLYLQWSPTNPKRIDL